MIIVKNHNEVNNLKMLASLTFKIILGGEGGVGKTTLLHKYIENRFLEDTRLTIGVEILNKEITLPDESLCALQLWDFGGQERFRFMQDSFVRGASGAFLMFDLTVLFTFNKLNHWVQLFRKFEPKLPIVLLGSKFDLENHTVEDEYVEEFMKANNIYTYLKASSKTGQNVNEGFTQLLNEVIEYKSIL
jgi:small GTP-binding protein